MIGSQPRKKKLREGNLQLKASYHRQHQIIVQLSTNKKHRRAVESEEY